MPYDFVLRRAKGLLRSAASRGFRFMCRFAFIVLYGSPLDGSAMFQCSCSNAPVHCANQTMRISRTCLYISYIGAWVSRPAESPPMRGWPRVHKEKKKGRKRDTSSLLSVTHTPSMSAGLYPQPPAACLEQQQWDLRGAGKETAADKTREERGEGG